METPGAHSRMWPQVGIFLILAIYLLEWGHEFLVPVTAAILGFFVVLPLERRLSRLGVPSLVTALCVTVGLAALAIVFLLSMLTPFTELVQDLPAMIHEIGRNLSGLSGGAVEKLREAADAAEDVMGDGDSQTLEVEVKQGEWFLSSLMAYAPAIGTRIALSLVLLFFLIQSGSTLLAKLVDLAPRLSDKKLTLEIVTRVSDKLGTYLGGITAINAGLGLTVGTAMYLLGVPNPVMFGFLAFALNYVPILGAVVGATLAALVGYSDSGETWMGFATFATYMALTSFEAQFVTPYLLSMHLRLNPPVIFLSVAFFAWIWSVIGMVVAVPILIAAKILFDEFPATRGIGHFLGAGGAEFERDEVVET